MHLYTISQIKNNDGVNVHVLATTRGMTGMANGSHIFKDRTSHCAGRCLSGALSIYVFLRQPKVAKLVMYVTALLFILLRGIRTCFFFYSCCTCISRNPRSVIDVYRINVYTQVDVVTCNCVVISKS